MILTTAATPIFLSKNYLTKDTFNLSKYTASSMSAILERIADMDPYSYWQSAGSSDGAQEYFTCWLCNTAGGIDYTDIALIALLNTNIKTGNIKLSSDYGASFHTTYAITDNTLSDYILDISAGVKAANYIEVNATHTIVAGEEKKVGTVILAGLKKQMVNTPDFPIVRTDKENIKITQMLDGSESITRIKRSAASYSFYRATFQFSYISQVELESMRAFRRANTEFLFYPEPNDKPREIYLCRFDGPFVEQASAACKGLGYNLKFSVVEVG